MNATPSGRVPRLLLPVALCLAGTPWAAAQKVKIDRCSPSTIRAGEAVEITLAGGGLEGASLWTSFPARVERIDEKAPRFRVTTSFSGAGAIRAHSRDGVSNLCFVEVEAAGLPVVNCEKRTRAEDAQPISLPAIVRGVSANLGAHHYRFRASAGQAAVIFAEARESDFDGVLTIRAAENGQRLCQADDHDVHGADPWLEFVAPGPESADYIIELIDSQYRGGRAFQLSVGETGIRPDSAHSRDEGIYTRDFREESEAPVDLGEDASVAGVLETTGDTDTFRFDLVEKRFVTITPTARALGSPVIPRLRLTDSSGAVISETPADLFEEEPLRLWLDPGSGYRLSIRDAFGRSGRECRYHLEIDRKAVPFELSPPGQRDKKHPLPDKFVAVPGGLFDIPVQCHRHQFDPAIQLSVESSWGCRGEAGQIAGKQGHGNLRVRLPHHGEAGNLRHVWVSGRAGPDGRQFESHLQTGKILRERDPGATIPNALDGALAVRVVANPLTVEISPPGEIAAGETLKLPVKLKWHDEARKFNSRLKLAGLPGGISCPEKELNANDNALELELKAGNPASHELKNLRVEVRLDYHGQALLVESEPFSMTIKEKNETAS